MFGCRQKLKEFKMARQEKIHYVETMEGHIFGCTIRHFGPFNTPEMAEEWLKKEGYVDGEKNPWTTGKVLWRPRMEEPTK